MTGGRSPPATARAALDRRDDGPTATIDAHRREGGENGPGRVRRTGTRRTYRIGDAAVANVRDLGRAIGAGD